MRLIDADATKDYAKNHLTNPYEIMSTCAMIDSAETVDVKPIVHGKWIDHGSFVTCSICGEEQYGYDNGRKYCQNCSAKMDLV